MQVSTPNEVEYLASARSGDPEAFTALVEPYRSRLIVHCYRMCGSLDDAEDIVQETLLRAWTNIRSFKEQGSFRNWLYVIATRLWLDEVRRRKRQVLLPLDGTPADPDTPPRPPASAGTWLDPLPDAWLSGADPSAESSYDRRETISLAFMVALQQLNPRQRVVLILRTVFNWQARHVADALGLTVPSVNNLLYRARKNLATSSNEEVPATQHNLDHFVNAWESGDVPALIDLLGEKATFAMPPMGVWYAGREAIQRALQNYVFTPSVRWKLVPTSANGRPAFGIYQQSKNGEPYQAFGIVLPLWGAKAGKVIEITAFLSPRLVTRFDLPQTLAP